MKAAESAVVGLGTANAAGCVIGRFLGLSMKGLPLVDYEGNPVTPLGSEARAACAEFMRPEGLTAGRELVLQFERGDPARPIVVGLIQPPAIDVRADGGAALRLVAERRLELVCGKASIVLSADGKIVVKGTHLVSRSSGPNKIRGATVDIN